MLLKVSRSVLVRRLTPFDAASCNKNCVVLDRYEVVRYFQTRMVCYVPL